MRKQILDRNMDGGRRTEFHEPDEIPEKTARRLLFTASV
jgi:hypothetical protein